MLHLPQPAFPFSLPCCSSEQLQRAVATTQHLRQDFFLSVRAWGFAPKVQEQRHRLPRHQARQQAVIARRQRGAPKSCAPAAIAVDSAAMAHASSPRRLAKEQE
jgi:hypothetical protein